MRKLLLVGLIASVVAFGTVAVAGDYYYTAPIDTTRAGTGHRAVNYLDAAIDTTSSGNPSRTDCFWGEWTIELYCEEDSSVYVGFYDLYEYPTGTTAIRCSTGRWLEGDADYCEIGWADSIHVWMRQSPDSGQVTAHGDMEDYRNIHGQ